MRTLDCSICGNKFTTNHSRQITCSKECSRISGTKLVKQWRSQNPSLLQASDLRKRYWPLLSNQEALAMYNLLLEQQNNKCAICYESQTSKNLAVDHCHETGKIRGLLCYRCNSAIGLLRDDIKIAENLVAYLVT